MQWAPAAGPPASRGSPLHCGSPPPTQTLALAAVQDSLSQELRASSSVRDSCFAFRLRRAPGAPPHLHWVHGHVFCRCRHDERLRRGAEQRSVVLLSWLPLGSVLGPLAHLVGPLVLSYGPEALRQVGALPAPCPCWPLPRLQHPTGAPALRELRHWVALPAMAWPTSCAHQLLLVAAPTAPCRFLRRCSGGRRWSGAAAWSCRCWACSR